MTQSSSKWSIDEVVRKHLCVGCGACAGMMPGRFEMVDQPSSGRRPSLVSGCQHGSGERAALAVCPGLGSGPKPFMETAPAKSPDLSEREWGSVLEVWEGYATDPALRWRGSSGGAVSAIAAYALENGAVGGVVHVRQDPANAILNESVISRDADAVASAAGSRYGPASPCDRLDDIATSDSPVVFIGKPCDIQALNAAGAHDPRIARNTALTVSIFCAGTPSSDGTRALLDALEVPGNARISGIKYRGEGWPGSMCATYVSGDGTERRSREISYEEGWGRILQRHRQWRCHLCADHTGELADISIGDPWDRPRNEKAGPGSSLVVIRTQRGRAMFRKAMEGGAISAQARPRAALGQAQPNLAIARRMLFGRLLGMRMLGLAAPRYPGWGLGWLWLFRLGMRARVTSVVGTMRRAMRRRLWNPEAEGRGVPQ